ncbi:unnamed protein product [Microthlaspi erraticum]|uniref:Uncharacterized protein n=1 Tax=Microthlaspi erraticum TaxID=1685480 RepID=A0A6D2KTX9_9BRAS|nr:unnamed protein product [Microthlaspi erraticum]
MGRTPKIYPATTARNVNVRDGGRDTQLLMRDKNRPNQSDGDIECSMETKLTWTNQDATPTTGREYKLQEWMRSKCREKKRIGSRADQSDRSTHLNG